MKLYENVIKALFVSFRSEQGRSVIRNAFAPRDGGHLLLAQLRSSPLPLPHFLSLLCLSFSSSRPTVSLHLAIVNRYFSFSLDRFSFSPSLLIVNLSLSLSPTCLLARFFGSLSSGRKRRRSQRGKKAGRWKDLATEGE